LLANLNLLENLQGKSFRKELCRLRLVSPTADRDMQHTARHHRTKNNEVLNRRLY